MKRNLGLVMFALFLASVFTAGCTQKSVVREDRIGAQEPATVVEAAAAEAPEAEAMIEGAEKTAPAGQAATEAAPAEKDFTEEAIAEKAAAEKAATEKATAEKAAVEKAALEKEIIELADINFDFDESSLRDDAREQLKKYAEWLSNNQDVTVVVEGHCDEKGTAEYNLALGERRARAAAKFLIDMGVDAKRIKTISYGEELPLDQEHNEESWAKNRRAHFVVSGKK